jgi:hypothetical protein
MIEITDVYFVDTNDPDYEPGIESGFMLIDKRLVLDIESDECTFYIVTGEFDGIPAVDVSISKSVIIETKIDRNEVDWLELVKMPFSDVIEKLAK